MGTRRAVWARALLCALHRDRAEDYEGDLSLLRPKITMTLLVRNEEYIIADTILFHHALGVDSFIVMDNLSTDATPDILRDLSRTIEIETLIQSQDDYDQSAWVTEMARRAATNQKADWIINSDAD